MLFRVEYEGIHGIVVAETVLEGVHFNLWTVQLSDGRIIEAPMNHFTLVGGVSMLEDLKRRPVSDWADVA